VDPFRVESTPGPRELAQVGMLLRQPALVPAKIA